MDALVRPSITDGRGRPSYDLDLGQVQRVIDVLLYLSDGYLTGMLLWLVAGGLAFWLLLRLRSMWRDKPSRIRWIHAGLSVWMSLAVLTSFELYFALIYDASDSFNMTNVSKKWFALH